MTSRTRNLVRRIAAIAAHAEPTADPARKQSAIVVAEFSAGPYSATPAAAVAPMSNCPSAPTLNTPARKAMATAKPVSIRGVARTSVPEANAYHDPNAPFNKAEAARIGSYRKMARNNPRTATNPAAIKTLEIARAEARDSVMERTAPLEKP